MTTKLPMPTNNHPHQGESYTGQCLNRVAVLRNELRFWMEGDGLFGHMEQQNVIRPATRKQIESLLSSLDYAYERLALLNSVAVRSTGDDDV